MFRWVIGFIFLLTPALFAPGCAKGPKAGENTNAVQANRQEQSAAASPHLQQTLKGDIERTSLLISMARDSAKTKQWPDAVAHLRAARKEVETALGRKPRLREEFEALKSAIDRTLPALENRSKDADSKLVELQTRIGAIKTNTYQQ